MSVSMYDAASAPQPPPQMSAIHPMAIARPQVSIERLPTRRMSNEPRESMNCKSCRKRKIKCNRLRPACEACQVFQCPCIYDAVPKKRGPKTDVLDALLKRVDGLEAKLKEKNAEQTSPTEPTSDARIRSAVPVVVEATQGETGEPAAKRLAIDTKTSPQAGETSAVSSNASVTKGQTPPPVSPDALLDTYFARFHAKPYHILDESSIRQRMQLGQMPEFLIHAIYAVASRYTPHPGGYQSAITLSQEYAARARSEVNIDEPSIDALQATLLLVTAFTAAGKGKKAYMLMTMAVGMATALEIHRESDQQHVTPMETETQRRLFWTCYLLDRFLACGSKRPSLISDRTIMLRLPSWMPSPSSGFIDGEFFQAGSNLQHFQGSGKKSQGSTGMLIDISRILGVTNMYLAAGGVRGDSHFPWHSLSNLSKIRHDLDTWASGTDDVFSSLETLFGQADSTVLVLSKLIYHLIHCLIYRPFLPIDLSELTGSGQHESWQIEATNMCFLHANAIAELIELGKQTSTIEWPAFVGYCICTAGTVHIHGAHYSKQGTTGGMSVFSSSAHFLNREMQHLSELRYAWASVQHHRETLQGIYNAHNELVKSLTGSMRFAPSFHLEDFFDRYLNIGGMGGQSFHFDAANLSLSDAVIDFTADTYSGHDLYAPRAGHDAERPGLKRKNTGTVARKQSDSKAVEPSPTSATMPNPTFTGLVPQPSPGIMGATAAGTQQQQLPGSEQAAHVGLMDEVAVNSGAVPAVGAPGFAVPNNPAAATGQAIAPMPQGPFSPAYNFGATANVAGNQPVMHDAHPGYDPMFGGLPTNAFSSPAAWHGDDGHSKPLPVQAAGGARAAPSPGNRSNNGSTGTTQGDEKDPFLSLLEQLAENEQRFNNGTSELDFFLAGGTLGGN